MMIQPHFLPPMYTNYATSTNKTADNFLTQRISIITVCSYFPFAKLTVDVIGKTAHRNKMNGIWHRVKNEIKEK